MTTTRTIPNPYTWPASRWEGDVEPVELRLTPPGKPPVHLVSNGDLDVILECGQKGKQVDRVPNNVEDAGRVIVSLGVDGEHDEVHYCGGSVQDTLELLSSAVETLTACRDVVQRIHNA
jgi:hypothetical protein